MIEAVVAWFLTSKVGRTIALVAAGAAALAIALLKAFNNGKQAERAEQDKATLRTIRQRDEIENEVNNLGHDDLDRRGRRWVRPPS